jgi:signal transduction histidine kinase
MNDQSIQVVVLVATAFFASLVGFIIYFIVLYRNKQLINKQEQEKLHSAFRQELLKAQIEMQEQTLTYVSREIHDNITQVLSFIKLDLSMIGSISDDQRQAKINENRELVSQVISDLRDLSKSLSSEHIKQLGLVKTIEVETNRINKSGVLQVALLTDGEIYSLGEQRELVLFRIFQEALNNTLKHSCAKHLKIALQYHSELFNLTLEDDGKGFLPGSIGEGSGSGLKNMENRATLIGAASTIDSSPGKGCFIKVTLNPLEQGLYADGYHPDRFG